MSPVSRSDGLSTPLPSILVVDDMPGSFELIKALLSMIDVNFVSASSGAQALELFDKSAPAVTLLDVQMPEMDGFEVAIQMRSRGSVVPIIFLTAQDRDVEFEMRAYSIGSADFLYRPLEPMMLRAKVQVFLDLFRLRQAEELKIRELEELHESLVQQWCEADSMSHELASQKTELERRNSELTLRNNQLDSFTHVISHDLRQPIGSILDYLELVRHSSGQRLDADEAGWIKSCIRIGQNMQSLIADVLDYSSLCRKPLAISPVDTNATLNSALESLHAAVRESGAVISHEALATVPGSERLLTSLWQNLIGNSIKYHGTDPPRIHISCDWRDEDREWCFRISDNGCGFKDQDRERIFEMFGRGGNVNGIPGTGIGLATCKRIVEAHGGRIWAESRSGEGSDFFFVLPDGGMGGHHPLEMGK